MNVFTPHPSRASRSQTQQLFLGAFKRQIQLLEKGFSQVKIPRCRPLYQCPSGMAYHFKPELFIQLGGSTRFSCPGEDFHLEPDQLCIMPKGVPHGEVAQDDVSSFENVVVCYYNETIAIHVAHMDSGQRPIVDDICFYTSPHFHDLVAYLDQLAELRQRESPSTLLASRGLLLAELALLSELVQSKEASLFSETERVFRCQWLIRNNIGDPELGVEALAQELQCSPSYLSKLFHQESGERITEYISRIRLKNAIEAVRSTTLSVKEVAVACGFSDPNYFTKVFRKSTGMTPVQMRADQQGIACRIEAEPKVVYHDRSEKNFGLRPEVMDRASARLEDRP